MSRSIDVAPARDARALVRATHFDDRLARFPASVQARVRALARTDQRLADLAFSFPALLCVLATTNRAAIVQRVIDGASLKELALQTRSPLWLRALPPEAFDRPLRPLPDSTWFTHRIANLIPKQKSTLPKWLDAIADAYHWADERVAIWVAREQPRMKPPPPRRRRRHDRRPPRPRLRIVCLWAWHCLHASESFETRWSDDMEMKAALDGADKWLSDIQVLADMGDRPVEDMWLPSEGLTGFELVPIRTGSALIEEARAMKHCVRTYSRDIADHRSRVWSIRKDGERFATLAIRVRGQVLDIQDLSLHNNAEAPLDLWRAVLLWLHTNRIDPDPSLANYWAPMDSPTWRRLWRPYWLAKGRIPKWLPLTPKTDTLWQI